MQVLFRNIVFSKFKNLKGLFLLLFVSTQTTLTSQAQNLDRNCKWIIYSADTFELDKKTIYLPSLKIRQPSQTDLKIIYDINTNKAHFQGKPTSDSILICYETFPFNLAQESYKRNPALYDSTDNYVEEFIKKSVLFEEKREELFTMGSNINKSGNITRGVSFGNAQNVFVNSALNLQIDGQLTKDLSIQAVISDQNVPFQPEGNTQQLQEFDRVFVKIIHKRGSLTAGDVVLKQKDNYFLKYYKNVQGGLLETHYDMGKNSKAESSVGIANSKGKFASIQVQALEGVQGPYRLTGPNGERFIIILAGSEKVYIDGKKLERGFNYDYIIDYNLAEVTFNTNVVITQFTRIRIDFEYAERNYNRSILTANHYQNYKNIDFYVSYYREADNPNNPTNLSLSDEDKESLNLAGDNTSLAFVSGVDSTEFSALQIQYRRTDSTTVNGTYEDVFVFSTDPNQAIFQVAFSEVGQGNGDYIRSDFTVNGQVYTWVEPVGGISQGNFAPVRIIPTPILKQMLNFGLAYNLNEQEKFYGEVAFSNQDQNRFSNLGNADNQGNAFKIGYKNDGKNIDFLDKYKWFAEVSVEFNNQFFKPIDRFRSIEYNRDWSVRSDTTKVADQIYLAQIGIKKDQKNQITYQISHRNRGSEALGWQHKLDLDKELANFYLKIDGFSLNSEQDSLRSFWQRFQGDLSYRAKISTIGYQYSLDKNRIIVQSSDSVLSTAMNFEQHLAYIQNSDSSKVKYRLDYAVRTDNIPIEGRLKRNIESQTANFTLSSPIAETQNIALTITYRNLKNLIDTTRASIEENIMGRVDWQATFLKRHIKSELTFATATGRELRREFLFLPVNTGEGTHAWRDNNGDGVQDLDEFFLAVNPDERDYIKVFTPTDEFINAFTSNFTYRLSWNAPRTWKKLKSWKGFLGKFSNVSSWAINKRFTDDNIASRLIPFNSIADEDLLSTQESLRSTLFFNRGNPNFGMDLNYLIGRQRQLLTNGFEARNNEDISLGFRKNLGKNWNLSLDLSQKTTENLSDFLLTRNFDIEGYKIEPTLAFQPSTQFRISTTYTYNTKENLFPSPESQETSQTHQFALETRWVKVGKRNLTANIRLINNTFNGESNTPVAYEMLEALEVGVNWTWTLNWQQRIAKGLQLTVNYQGRQAPNIDTRHFGTVQLTALF